MMKSNGMVVSLQRLLLLAAAVTTPTIIIAQTLLPCSSCPLKPACCEDDCCGDKTRWSPTEPGCVSDPSSRGWTGESLPGYVEGCALRSCCEDGCCKNGTFFNITQAYCVPLPNGGVPTPAPTALPTTSAIPTATDCEPLQSEYNASAPPVAVSAPDTWQFRDPDRVWPQVLPDPERMMVNWIYAWKTIGEFSEYYASLLEKRARAILDHFINDLSVELSCQFADECNDKVGTYARALCAAKKIAAHFQDPKNFNEDGIKCPNQAAPLASVLIKMNIPWRIEVRAWQDVVTGRVSYHSWVEVDVGDYTYMLVPYVEVYVCRPLTPLE